MEDFDVILAQIQGLFEYLEKQSNHSEVRTVIRTFEISQLRMKLQTTQQQVSNPVSYTHLDVYKRQCKYTVSLYMAMWTLYFMKARFGLIETNVTC